MPNKHLHARVAFLQQAATYLAHQCSPEAANDLPGVSDDDLSRDTNVTKREDGAQLSTVDMLMPAQSSGLPQHLSSQLRQVALKAQIRLDPSVKRAFCKTCNAVLVEGETCLKFIENLSRGGRKTHAKILVVKCQACGTKKRFPMAAARQRKKGEREKTPLKTSSVDAVNSSIPSVT